MFKKLKYIFHIIFTSKNDTAEYKENNLRIKTLVSFALLGVSLLLSIINFFTQNWFMAITTLSLSAVFGICVVLLLVFKATVISEILISFAVCFIFSYYAMSGNNEGFAILWIVIVPAVASLFLSYKAFLGVSGYFLIFLILIFYTPLKQYVFLDYYSDQFQIRFPVLYMASLILSFIIATQSIYYSTVSNNNALYDYMTNLKNRRYCADYINKIKDKPVPKTFTVVSFDINNLKTINDDLGHESGDQAICESARIIKEVFGSYTDKIYRMGGDEFLVFFEDEFDEMMNFEAQLYGKAKKVYIKNQVLSMSLGYVKGRDYISSQLTDLIKIAENNMYKAKEEYYKQNNIDRRRKSDLKITIK